MSNKIIDVLRQIKDGLRLRRVRRSRVLDWIFDTFGERELERIYCGHGDFKEKRIWTMKIFHKRFMWKYDSDFF